MRTSPDSQNVLAQPQTQVISGSRVDEGHSGLLSQTHRLCETFRVATASEQVYLHLRYRQNVRAGSTRHYVPLAAGALDTIANVPVPTGVRWEVYYVGGG